MSLTVSTEPKGHGSKFELKKDEAIAALLIHGSIDKASESIGIGTQTLLRWMKLPEFQKEYREARRTAFSNSIAALQQASTLAVSTLITILEDKKTPPSVRLRAADAILNHAKSGIEIEDFALRIEALEQTTEAAA